MEIQTDSKNCAKCDAISQLRRLFKSLLCINYYYLKFRKKNISGDMFQITSSVILKKRKEDSMKKPISEVESEQKNAEDNTDFLWWIPHFCITCPRSHSLQFPYSISSILFFAFLYILIFSCYTFYCSIVTWSEVKGNH